MGCMDDESEDGTTYWYMMANCRRAQAAYSVYSKSSGSTSCNKKDFKESFVTKDGVSEFVYLIGYYGNNAPVSSDDTSSLPICESDGNGYYYGTGCSSSGTFTIDRFSDPYCTQYYDTYDTLSNFNYKMKSLSKCYNTYSTRTDEDPSYSLATYLIQNSATCTEYESSLCKTSDFVKNSGSYSSAGARATQKLATASTSSFAIKLKYGLGMIMLAGSIVMFLGILVTNRKKRRALMHRRFRHSTDRSKSRSKSSKNKKSSSKKKSKREPGTVTNGIFA